MNQKFLQISVFLTISTLISCHRPPEFPLEPQIGFERLHLTDTATLVLTFNVTDGNGDIGLSSENESLDDVSAPFHIFSIATKDEQIVTINDETTGPYEYVPAALLTTSVNLFKGQGDNGPIFETSSFLAPFRVGEGFEVDPDQGKPSDYECENYEIISFFNIEQEVEGNVVISERLEEDIDTVLVIRNENYFNLHMDLLVKSGNDFVRFDAVEDCGVGSSARFPVFDRSDIGRPLDGSIQYAFFSVLFRPENVEFLTGTYKLEFYILDRSLQKSNVVESPEFNFLGLRSGDLTPN